VLIFPLAVGAGVVLGYLREGSLRGLGQLRFRGFAWLAAALGIQVALPLAPTGWRGPLTLLSYSLIGAWFLSNTGQRPVALRCGLLLIVAGWSLNLVPIALNGAMPVSFAAIREVPASGGVGPGVDIRKHEVAGRGTRLPWLGDVLPVAPLRSVVSAGDLVMGAGLAITVAAAMAGRGERAPTAPGRRRWVGRLTPPRTETGRPPATGCSGAAVRGSAAASDRCCRWGCRERR
jgi:hypothetical protein